MGSLVAGEISPVGGLVFGSWVVPSGASHFMADETFVVSDVFGALGGGEVDSIHIHCHRVLSSFFGPRWDKTGPFSWFLHAEGGIVELSCFV